jgi:uncharacterized protein YjbJ (UPF0337 family)
MDGAENILKGNWMQARGQVKAWWGDLTDDEIDEIDGNRMKLAGKLRERYGWQQTKVDSEIDRFVQSLQENRNGNQQEHRQENREHQR